MRERNPIGEQQPHIIDAYHGKGKHRRPRKLLTPNRVVAWGFGIGNVALMAKAGLHPDTDTAAGVLFTAQAVSLNFGEKHSLAYPFAGITGIAASAFLSSKGIDFHTGEIRDIWRTVSPMAGFGTTASLLLFEKGIREFAKKAKDSPNRLKRMFASTQQYPIASAAVVDTVGLVGTAVSAISNKDWATLGILGIWGIGEGGLVFSEPSLRERFQNYGRDRRSLPEPLTEVYPFPVQRRVLPFEG